MGPWKLILPVCLLTSCVAPPRLANERQITNVMGDARSPALSRDGTAIAFAGVAPGYTNPQIWIAPADGSAPPRPLTNDSSKNYDPEFSPDGRSVYFTSSREPQGIYRVPSFGGTAEMVIPDAYSARISPDGNAILYGMAGKVVERPLAGGATTVLLPAVSNSYAPLWSPDGKQVLVTSSTQQQREPEWYIVPVSGAGPRKTSLGADLRSQGFNYIATNAWLPDNWIIFTGRQGETQTLWKVRIAPDGNTTAKAVRATDDAEGDYDASFGAAGLIFARTRVDANYWALPLDETGEHITASPVPLTSTSARKGQQSAAGQKLLYSAESGDRFSLFLQDGDARNKDHVRKLGDGFFLCFRGTGQVTPMGMGARNNSACI